MARQYLRQISLKVGQAGGDAIDLSALRIRFKIEQQTVQTPNSAVIRVWNLSEDTAKTIRQNAEGASVILQAGYEGGPLSTVFNGDLVQVRKGRENALDAYVDLLAGEGDRAHSFAVVSTTLAAGATLTDQIKAVVQAMEPYGVTLGYLPPDLPGGAAPRGVTLHGMAKDRLNDLAETCGCTWSITDGKVNVVPKGQSAPGASKTAVVLTAQTGMIGVPEQTADGIHVRALLDGQFKANGAVRIDNSSITEALKSVATSAAAQNNLYPSIANDGFYTILYVTHEGDSRGPEWYSDLICVAYGDGTPIAFTQSGKLP